MSALFAVLKPVDITPGTRHYAGLPPELDVPGGGRQPLPLPAVIVIEEREDGVFLLRYSRDGEFGGDTWHTTVGEAKEQAATEYDGLIDDWFPVPADAEDHVAFALSQLT